jgi:uncharacterized membrane protein YjjP (DUF1212 family)
MGHKSILGWSPENTADPRTKGLSREEVRDAVDLLLWGGAILLQNGADTALVERTVAGIARGLGVDAIDVLVSPNGLVVTTTEGDDFRTKLRRVPDLGVNMAKMAAVVELTPRVMRGELGSEGLRKELGKIDGAASYPKWLVALAIGAACGGFAELFHGGLRELGCTFVGGSLVMALRQALHKRHTNPYLTILAASLSTGVLLSLFATLARANATICISATAVQLIPGVLFVHAARDIIKGHLVTGIARATKATATVLAIAVGLVVSAALYGRFSR